MPSMSTALNFATHFAQTYIVAAPRIAYRMTLSCLFDPKGAQDFLHGCLDWRDKYTDDAVLGSADPAEILPGEEDLKLEGPYHVSSNAETRVLLEIATVAHVMRALNPTLVFEFGTFIGRMTRLMALNAPNAQIATLDLPAAKVAHVIGRDYAGRPEAARITQLHGDSKSFDYSSWAGRCDFVWVDACHDYPFVISDTLNAIALCRPGGWIGWHDYRHSFRWSGVTKAVRELRGRFEFIRHVRGTTTALGKVRT